MVDIMDELSSSCAFMKSCIHEEIALTSKSFCLLRMDSPTL